VNGIKSVSGRWMVLRWRVLSGFEKGRVPLQTLRYWYGYATARSEYNLGVLELKFGYSVILSK
jgi:ribosomal protein S3